MKQVMCLVGGDMNLAASLGKRMRREIELKQVDAAEVSGITSPAAIVVIERGEAAHRLVATLNTVRTTRARCPVIVVTPFSRESATALVGAACARVVWLDECEEELPRALDSLAGTSLRIHLHRSLADKCSGTPALMRALTAIGVGTVPPSVDDLARRASCVPATLRWHWRRIGLPDGPAALLEMTLLADAAELRGAGVPWKAVATTLGVPLSRLRRMVSRRTGQNLASATGPVLEATITTWLREGVG